MAYLPGGFRMRGHVAWQVPCSFLDNVCLLVICSVAPCSRSTMIISLETIPETHVPAGNSQVPHQFISYCLVTGTKATQGERVHCGLRVQSTVAWTT